MAMHVGSLQMDLRIRHADSLKARRAVVTPIIEGARRRHHVAAADIDGGDDWHLATVGFSTVSGSPRQVTEALDAVERFVWSFPDVEILDAERRWLDSD